MCKVWPVSTVVIMCNTVVILFDTVLYYSSLLLLHPPPLSFLVIHNSSKAFILPQSTKQNPVVPYVRVGRQRAMRSGIDRSISSISAGLRTCLSPNHKTQQ
jgi:hypothetical protein